MSSENLFDPGSGSGAAYLLDGKGGGGAIEGAAVDSWKPDDGVLWTHLNYSDDQTKKWLSENAKLDSLVIEALTAEETRPRTALFENGLLTILRGVNLTPGAEPEDMVSIRIWIDNDRIISARKRDLLSINDLIRRLEKKKGPTSPSSFLVQLTGRLVDRIGNVVDQFEDRIADLEEAVLEETSGSLKSKLSEIRREAIILRRYLAPEKEALSEIISDRDNVLSDDERSTLRETNDRLLRYIEEIDVIRERATVTQEELHSRISEMINSRMYVLSVIAAIFLPLGFLTGLLGINVAGIPGAENPYAFYIFVAGLIGIVLAQITLFRWRNWM